MKKHLLFFLFMLLPMAASAQSVEIDGIYYNLVSKIQEAEVTQNPNNYTGSVVIPEKVTYESVEYSVTSIGEWAFQYCSGLTSITIPNSVTSIGEQVFRYCSGLTSVTIGSGVTSIGERAFYGCSGLTKVIVKDIAAWCGIKFDGSYSNPLSYAKHIYSDEDTEITNLIIPNSVTSIGNYAFFGCSSLISITIGNSVTSIGTSAFYKCSGLKKVIVKDIAAWCGIKFDDYDSNPIYYAEHIYSDEDTEITNLIIPNSVTSIGNWAFEGCSGLTSVTIPNSVTSIGERAFDGCSGLASVTIPNSVTSIGGHAFSSCSKLTSVTIPNSVTSIGDFAFGWCTGLTSVTIPNSVTSIGNNAFYSCYGLTSVTIPNSVTSIGSSAFDGVDIPTIISLIENPFTITGKTSNSRTFSQNTFLNATLYVPKGTIDKYKATDGWKDFLFIEEGTGGGDTPTTQKCEKPTISYENGKLTFTSETEGAVCQYSITDTDIKAGSGNEVQLGVTYNISVYATKSGYENSETATATLCWIDQQPKTEGITNGIANIPANAVLIQSEGGSIKVQGVDEGTQVNVYSVNGTQAGSAISQSGAATINTNLQPGSIAIVKIGQKSVKVVVK